MRNCPAYVRLVFNPQAQDSCIMCESFFVTVIANGHSRVGPTMVGPFEHQLVECCWQLMGNFQTDQTLKKTNPQICLKCRPTIKQCQH